MKGAVDATRALIENYEAVGRIIGKLAATYGVLKVATVISTFATMGDVVAIKALTKAQALLNKTMLKNPYVAVISLVATLGIGMWELAKSIDSVEKSKKRANKAFDDSIKVEQEEIATLDVLYKRLENAERGTKEWESAKSAIITQFGKYNDNLEAEIESVGNLADTYNSLRDSIRDAAMERGRSQAISEASATLADKTSKHMGTIAKALRDVYGTGSNAILSQFDEYFKTGKMTDELESIIAQFDEANVVMQSSVGASLSAGTNKVKYAAEQIRMANDIFNETIDYINSQRPGGSKDGGTQKELDEWQKIVDSFVEANDASFQILRRRRDCFLLYQQIRMSTKAYR